MCNEKGNTEGECRIAKKKLLIYAHYYKVGKMDYVISISQPPIPGGECEIIRGCHNRDKGTAENGRLRYPKLIFSYPKNERLIFLSGRNDAQKKFRP